MGAVSRGGSGEDRECKAQAPSDPELDRDSALEPKSGVEHSGNNSGGEPPGSETVDRCPRMCKRVFVFRGKASPIFAPQLSCKSSL